MKTAHLFSLKASFKNGVKWDLKVVAVDITWVTMYAPKEGMTSINIELLKENYAHVENNFGSSDYTDELEKEQKRWKTIKR